MKEIIKSFTIFWIPCLLVILNYYFAKSYWNKTATQIQYLK